MIQPLRRRHRRMVPFLALVVGVVLAASWMAREPVPAAQIPPPLLAGEAGMPLPDETGTPLPSDAKLELSTTMLSRGRFEEPPIVFELREASGGDRWLMVTPESDPRSPDLLLYWVPSGSPAASSAAAASTPAASSSSAALPESAFLLGRIGGTRQRMFRLPDGAAVGELVLFSLAHARVLARARVEDC